MISTSDFQSNSLDQVKNSIERNGIAIKGVIDIPLVSYTGEVQNVNQQFRNALDLFGMSMIIQS